MQWDVVPAGLITNTCYSRIFDWRKKWKPWIFLPFHYYAQLCVGVNLREVWILFQSTISLLPNTTQSSWLHFKCNIDIATLTYPSVKIQPYFCFSLFLDQDCDHSWSLPKALRSAQRFSRFATLRIKITFAFCKVLLEKAGHAAGLWWDPSGFEGALQVHVDAENSRQQPVLVPVEHVLHWRAAAVHPGGK